MTSPDRLIADFLMAGPERRRALLLSIGKQATDLRLGAFGAEPAESPVHVVDTGAELHVVDRMAGLEIAARSMAMEIYPPTPMQDASGSISRWDVWYTMGEHSQVLATGASEQAAQAACQEALEPLVGTLVITLTEWVSGQLHAGFEHAPKKRRGPTFGHLHKVEISGDWLAAGVYRWHHSTLEVPTKMKEAEVAQALEKTGSFFRISHGSRSAPRYQLLIGEIEGRLYAQYHDLVNAARHGVFLDDVLPWPNVSANAYVVTRELTRFMRLKGWRTPWLAEEVKRPLRAFGQVWLRAEATATPAEGTDSKAQGRTGAKPSTAAPSSSSASKMGLPS